MSRLSLLIDVDKCTGCYNCFLACRDEHYGNEYAGYSAAQPLDGQFWMQITEIETGTYPRPRLFYIPRPCMHCQAASCMEVARNQAVYRRPDGIVLIDPEKAKGQQDIVNACPYRVIFWNEARQIPQKCGLCAHRLDQGAKEPRCVESCPTGALVFGDLDDPQSAIAQLATTASTEAFHPEFKTAPSVRYLNLPRSFINGEVVFSDRPDICAAKVNLTLEGDGVKFLSQTDAFGEFEFKGLEKNKSYRITIQQAGYAAVVQDIYTRTNINMGTVVLKPL